MTAPRQLHLIRPSAYRDFSRVRTYCGIPRRRFQNVMTTDEVWAFKAVLNRCTSCLRNLEGGR